MTLLQQLTALRDRLRTSTSDIVIALGEKGVTVSSDILISQVADAIRLIHQSNFNFIFDFKSIDQFGNPHVPDMGYETTGMTGIDQSFEFTYLDTIDFNEPMIWDSVEDLKGAFGVSTVGFDPAFDLEPSMEELESFHFNN